MNPNHTNYPLDTFPKIVYILGEVSLSYGYQPCKLVPQRQVIPVPTYVGRLAFSIRKKVSVGTVLSDTFFR